MYDKLNFASTKQPSLDCRQALFILKMYFGVIYLVYHLSHWWLGPQRDAKSCFFLSVIDKYLKMDCNLIYLM